MWFNFEISVQENFANSWKINITDISLKLSWNALQLYLFYTFFPMCHVLAFFSDEWCCRVLEFSCYLSLNQECGGGYLRTKYCRTSPHIFGFLEWSWAVAEWLEGEHSLLMLPEDSRLAAHFAMSTRRQGGSELHLLLFHFSLEIFEHKCYLSDKVNCGPGPQLILLDTTAAVNNALPWITSASWKLINLAATQTWRRISP